ncbi:hypothetical protein [Nocardioides sp. CF8]|nr:hypothetical protein [Nocardioides sp. CF8]
MSVRTGPGRRLGVANSPWGVDYERFWGSHLLVEAGGLDLLDYLP